MRLLLKDPKYTRALNAMNISHGVKYDCMIPDCPVCESYREKEREEWENLTEEERKEMVWGVIG